MKELRERIVGDIRSHAFGTKGMLVALLLKYKYVYERDE